MRRPTTSMEHIVNITDRATILTPPLDSGGKWVISFRECRKEGCVVYTEILYRSKRDVCEESSIFAVQLIRRFDVPRYGACFEEMKEIIVGHCGVVVGSLRRSRENARIIMHWYALV